MYAQLRGVSIKGSLSVDGVGFGWLFKATAPELPGPLSETRLPSIIRVAPYIPRGGLRPTRAFASLRPAACVRARRHRARHTRRRSGVAGAISALAPASRWLQSTQQHQTVDELQGLSVQPKLESQCITAVPVACLESVVEAATQGDLHPAASALQGSQPVEQRRSYRVDISSIIRID